MENLGTEKLGESSEEIVAKVIESLTQNGVTDTSLLEILTKHVVSLSPAENAVDLAVEDIEALAKERGEKID